MKHECNIPIGSPTKAPSKAPSEVPSQSPTLHPIIISDFHFVVSAFFRISGWRNCNVDIGLVPSSITTYIHQGFDNDDNLKHGDIVLNITNITNHPHDGLVNDNQYDLLYLIKCADLSVCQYITGESSTIKMDRTVFETFVTTRLKSQFSSDAVQGDTNHPLLFTVMKMTMITNTDESKVHGIDIFVTILFIFGAVCLFISGISIGVILYHQKRQRAAVEGRDKLQVEEASPLTPTKEPIRRLSSSHNAEGQEGVPATENVSAHGEGEIPDKDDHLNQVDSDSETSQNVVRHDKRTMD